jgi:hypothetical protein
MNDRIELKTASGAGADAMRALLAELRHDDTGMERCLLDAALSGLALSRNPSSKEDRRRADKAWKAISGILSDHLTSEDDSVIPWAENLGGIAPELAKRVHDQHKKLRSLSAKIGATSILHDSDGRIAKTAEALCEFAMCLDDVIAGERHELFPALRRVIFRAAPVHSH